MRGYFQSERITLTSKGISGLVVEYNVAIVVTRVRFPADALLTVVVEMDAKCTH